MLFVSTTSATAHAFLLPFAQYMHERGHDISFACSSQSFADVLSRVKELRDAGFVVHEISFAREIRPVQDVRAFWRLTQLIRSNSYDLVHTHTSKAGFIGRFAAKVARCPITVHTAHDFFFRAYDLGLKRQVFLWLEKIAAPFCDAMLFVSEAVRQDAIRYHLKNKTALVLVGNGIDVAKYASFRTDVAAVRSQYGIKKADLWVGSVGRLVQNKGLDTFIRAAALVLQQRPDAHFIIAGDGPLRTELEALACSLGIAAQVQFVGFLPETEDIMSLMSSLNVFVLPTRREGLGIVYLEAMALQCPVVGSRISPVTEVVKDKETGLLATVDDPEEFARAILVLLEDSDLRRRMGAAGPIHVEHEFDQRRGFERIEVAYQRMAGTIGTHS
jgi:glycosyltransferase involved in cell wall biosynthesis